MAVIQYRIFDLQLASNLALPELATASADRVDIKIRLTAGLRPLQGLRWRHHWRDGDGAISLSIAKSAANYYLRFPQLADFMIGPGGNSILIVPAAGVAETSVRHLLLDQVLPRVLAQRGVPVLHASAVAIDRKIVAFVGESGAGKSTIATALHRQEMDFLADDCLAVQDVQGTPCGVAAYSGARLWDDSPALVKTGKANFRRVSDETEKWRVPLQHSCPALALPLLAVFVIQPDYNAGESSQLRVQTLPGSKRLMALVEHSFKLDLFDHANIGAQFVKLAGIVNSGLPVYQLDYPHRARSLENLGQAIRAALPGSVAGARARQ